jgi:hypothetical protein
MSLKICSYFVLFDKAVNVVPDALQRSSREVVYSSFEAENFGQAPQKKRIVSPSTTTTTTLYASST